jgi:hypothetical protein
MQMEVVAACIFVWDLNHGGEVTQSCDVLICEGRTT